MPEKRIVGELNARYNELSLKVLRNQEVSLSEFQEVGNFILQNHTNLAEIRRRYGSALSLYKSGKNH